MLDIHLRWSVAPGYEGSLSKVFVSIADITARKKAEATIQHQTTQASMLVDLSTTLSEANLQTRTIYKIIVENTANLVGDSCVLTLLSGDGEQLELAAFHHTNPAALELMTEMFASSLVPAGTGAVRQVIATGKPMFLPRLADQDPHRLINPDYAVYQNRFGIDSLMVLPLIVQGQVIGTLGLTRDHPGRPYTDEDLSFVQNIANQAALTIQNARLHDLVIQQAHTDALTGMHNRRSFFDRAEMEFARAERYQNPLSVILLDLDHFKAVNDRFGHTVGDQVLCTVAERCRANIRTSDMVGRIGGEEFAILLPETDLAGAALIAERLRVCIGGSPILNGGSELRLTVSLGVAAKDAATPEMQSLLQQADEQMYAAKQAGRNRVSMRSLPPV
jgi:diguanylate cyclase (GGDEF)-like protein